MMWLLQYIRRFYLVAVGFCAIFPPTEPPPPSLLPPMSGTVLRMCQGCNSLKAREWFDLRQDRCNSCSRLGGAWETDATEYEPLIRSVIPEIDWTTLVCPNPNCTTRLFREEVLQFREKTGMENAMPCCCHGVAGISVAFPPNADADFLKFSPEQWRTANQALSSVATLPATLHRRSVVGLPNFECVYDYGISFRCRPC